jgi:enoyl-CoA hydratase/carnithine racemase
MRRIALPPSLTVASLDALTGALDEAAADAEARVWVLEGTPGVFCRGMDLSALSAEGGDAAVSLQRFAACLGRLRNAPRPTIALCDGEVMGGGIGLAAACDVVVATARSTFGLPEILFGLLPGAVLPVLLERLTPHAARLLTMRGHAHDAAWALAHGLVDELVAEGALDRAASAAARELGRAAPARILGLRTWIQEIAPLGADAALTRGAALTAGFTREPAVREAVRAFVEDGTPPWLNR